MIHMLNRAVLFQDSDSQACANVWSALKKNHIEYEMKTMTNHSTFGRNMHYKMGASKYAGGMPGSSFGDQMNYVYVIYVKKKDLALARKVCDL